MGKQLDRYVQRKMNDLLGAVEEGVRTRRFPQILVDRYESFRDKVKKMGKGVEQYQKRFDKLWESYVHSRGGKIA